MKVVYLNMKSSCGVETVDEFTRESTQSPKEFRKYVNEMVREYQLSGMSVYKSQRCTKDWSNK